MNKFFAFLSRYNRREQSILLLGALAVFLYLLWMAVLVPLQDWRTEQIQRNASVQQTLGRVKVLSARLEEYRRTDGGGTRSSGNLSRLIDSSLRSAGLTMSGFQPGTGGEARVRFDQVPYERFMQWLHDMEYRHDISVIDMTMAATNEQGMVTVNIRMQQN
ncbi:type II secretion system protein M [Marinimicrobium sp. ABcell2]|uniref:type II secretion system protein M n=1 Tax=Marinimicrobium sp. ABcell2 TaxID=3069751 RepID=UPI0027B6F110|nr:type II secretion system protein M [Marinimicrobium sp. ABcell2]MDQ2076654.1 type II secretion system protein M [Marinimicrobium sp. ABcell2]